MHMADALISPVVGGTMWLAATSTMAYALKKLKDEDIFESKKIPLMGVAGAFVFAAQMINFTIPGTGSSGHLGGGLLLAALLGPYAGFLVISVVLTIQALFFADGGLLALGCNIFNMGFVSCFLAYPLLYKTITAHRYTKKTILAGSLTAAIVGLVMGAACVVIETLCSGISELTFGMFSALMLPIHLAIGVVEGFVTSAVLIFIYTAQPSLLDRTMDSETQDGVRKFGFRNVFIGFVLATAICSTVLASYASSNPDGLEWSVMKTTGHEMLSSKDAIGETAARVQQSTSVMPGYDFKNTKTSGAVAGGGTVVAGLVGSTLVLLLAGAVGCIAALLQRNRNKKALHNK